MIIASTVTRYSFYDTPTGTLRFTEHAPPQPPTCDHTICGCTTDVTARPAAPRSSRETIIQLETLVPRTSYTGIAEAVEEMTPPRTFQLRFDTRNEHDGAVHFWILWPRTARSRARESQEPFSDHETHDRAYFWFNKELNRLSITVTGVADTPFLTSMFFGNKVDIQTLFNGHSPSRIVKLDAIPDQAVWVHACNWGDEAMTILSEGPDTRVWRAFRGWCEEMQQYLQRALGAAGTLEELQLLVESDMALQGRMGLCVYTLQDVLSVLPKTDLYQAASACAQAVHDANVRKARERKVQVSP